MIGKLTGDGFMAYYPTEQANSALQAGVDLVHGDFVAEPAETLIYGGVDELTAG